MSLYRQMILFTFVLFFLLSTGTWLAKLNSTRTFLKNQLVSHAQDTATSLSLSISPYVAQKDMVAVDGMISAVFDGGYYEMIRFDDPDNKPVINRVLDVKIEGVPPWFVSMLPLVTPEATANVMSGWKQGGTIVVRSHPGYAYKTLWSDTIRMTLWFTICAIFVLVVGGAGLHILLKPLLLVEKQADGLCKREYSILEPLPWTRELRRVVEAMNRMTAKVKEMFEEQVAQAEGLRERAYHDLLTGLGNRRFFESQIEPLLQQTDSGGAGGILLVRVHDLDQINQIKGFAAGDELLLQVAALLRDACSSNAQAVLARLSGGDFGVLVPDISFYELELLAGDISGRLGQLALGGGGLSANLGHVGGVTFHGSITLARLLAEADRALCVAMRDGMNAWKVTDISEQAVVLPLGRNQWREMLLKALSQDKIRLYAQPVVHTHDRGVYHLEIFSKLEAENGELVSAATFMPLAENLRLVASIDRVVIEKLVKLNPAHLGAERLAVNISPVSLQDKEFMQWIYPFLETLPSDVPRLSFEFSEFSAVQNVELLKEFSQGVRQLGHSVGLDHYGQSFSKLSYLRSVHPDYVKVDRGYTSELKTEASDSRFYVGALCSVAHSIDVAVIAEGVETELQAQVMEELNVDALQGYWCGRPGPVEEIS